MNARTGPTLPGAVSRALADVWTGVPRDVEVHAVYPRAVYLRIGGPRPLPADDAPGFAGRSRALPSQGALRIPTMVSLVTADGVHQPGSIVLGRRAADAPLCDIGKATTGVIGGGRLRLGDLEVTLSRWWEPRPSLAPVALGVLHARLRVLEDELAGAPADGRLRARGREVAHGLAAHDAAAAWTAARALLGYGPGLTPSGDDLLAGLIAGTRLLAPAVHDRDAGALVAAATALGVRVTRRAFAGATTSVSAALLGYAIRGEVVADAARVLHALTGRGDVRRATGCLLGVGATSGQALGRGLLLAGRAVARSRGARQPARTPAAVTADRDTGAST
jgi:hypothetical protein